MTTHEQQSVPDSHDEPPIPESGAPRMDDDRPTAAPSAEPPAAESSSTNHESSADDVLFVGENLAELRERWAGVQAAFVDDPKECVQKADVLVSDLVEQLTAGFAETRWHLEEQWNRGEEASTEDLRLALMHYRKFFDRLLAV
jgi:hypothetical protein